MAVPALASADGTLAMPNLSIADKGDISLDFDARIFDGREENEYYSGTLNYGLGGGYDLLVRFTTAEEVSFFAGNQEFFTGGDDVEVQIRRACALFPGAVLAVGASFPDTPHQDDDETFITASLTYSQNIGEGADFIYGVRTVINEGNELAGFSAGLNADISGNLSLATDVTAIIDGTNVHSMWGGNHEARMLYSAVLQLDVNDSLSLQAGITNMLGATTGMSLSAGAARTNAVVFGGTLRF